MPGFRVLSDSAVYELLINLTKTEILELHDKLAESLRQFSVTSEREYQPEAGVVVRPNGQKTLFRPFTSTESVGTKIIVHPAPATSDDLTSNAPKQLPLRGVVIVCDEGGIPSGLINAEELTGFRTALSAIVPYMWRRSTRNVVVFGAGMQAIWHLRLALALRGDEINQITVLNRSQARAEAMVEKIKEENHVHWHSEAAIAVLGTPGSAYAEDFKHAVSHADVIFCTVPSQRPLFSDSDLGEGAAPYIAAIGSWQPNMIEVDPALIQRITGQKTPGTDIVLVDDRESAMRNSGEIVQSKLSAEQMVEVGQAIEAAKDGGNIGAAEHDGLMESLANGLVVFKSVGVSLTDLAIGESLLGLAEKKGVGLKVSEF